MPRDRPGVILTAPEFNGTLAAVRALGQAGIDVMIAHHEALTPATWSRFVTKRLHCPPTLDAERFLDWLLHVRDVPEGTVLLPTGDDTAWLYARHREQLGRRYRLLPQSEATVYGLLNKQQLHAHCIASAVATPTTWLPSSPHDLAAIWQQARGPLVLKPRTQVLFTSRGKGELITSLALATQQLERFLAHSSYAPMLLAHDAAVRWPMLQDFVPAPSGIYNLSGFIGEDGELWGVRAGQKVLQQPRQFGIGLCFEEVPVEPEALAAVMRLQRRTGYRGVFEVEFIRDDERFLLIDFNPRFYGQMAFD